MLSLLRLLHHRLCGLRQIDNDGWRVAAAGRARSRTDQRFSWWMTQIMHRFPTESAFDRRRQLSDLDYLTASEAASRSLAEQYVGLPLG